MSEHLQSLKDQDPLFPSPLQEICAMIYGSPVALGTTLEMGRRGSRTGTTTVHVRGRTESFCVENLAFPVLTVG